MNLFDLFPEIEAATPDTPVKKATTKKAENKKDAKTSKNKVSLPAKLYIQYHSLVEITAKMLGINTDTADNNQIEEYAKTHFPVTKHMYFTYENDSVFAALSLISIKDKILIEDNSVFFFNGCELPLSDYTGEIDTETFLETVNNNGFSLPENTEFAKKENYIFPVLKTVSTDAIKSSLLSPAKVVVYGLKEFDVITEKAITSEIIMDTITKEYPALGGKIILCCLDAANNSVGAYICSNTGNISAGKKETMFVVKENTIIKLFSNTLNHNIAPGEYTHKQLCKKLSSLVPECNTPDSIFIKDFKKENMIILGIKFGGSKGGQ